MSKGAIVAVIAVIIILVIGFAYVVGVRNSMITKQADVENSWAQVENQYQRRADLIPNLVEAVKGIAKQELTVFTEVTAERSKWADAKTTDEKMQAASGLDNAISRLLLVAEDYPELKSNENFLALQDQLEGTENRIAVERMRYNEAVTKYNKYIKTWPNSSFAVWFNFGPKELFQAEEGVDQVPEVRF